MAVPAVRMPLSGRIAISNTNNRSAISKGGREGRGGGGVGIFAQSSVHGSDTSLSQLLMEITEFTSDVLWVDVYICIYKYHMGLRSQPDPAVGPVPAVAFGYGLLHSCVCGEQRCVLGSRIYLSNTCGQLSEAPPTLFMPTEGWGEYTLRGKINSALPSLQSFHWVSQIAVPAWPQGRISQHHNALIDSWRWITCHVCNVVHQRKAR